MSTRLSKRMKAAWAKVEKERAYSVEQAAEVIEQLPRAKFDESVDIAVKLGVDPRKAEENVRGIVALPHGTGKTIRVAVFCKGEKIKEAQDAGADFVGAEDLIARVQGGWLDFDSAIATPDMMGQVGKIGKLLGPRGLMPNPKTGTVAMDVAKAVKAIKAGQVEFRVEKAGIVHVGVARVSFGAKKIAENVTSILDALVRAKPKSAKGVYLEAIYISTTMGPSMVIDPIPFRKV